MTRFAALLAALLFAQPAAAARPPAGAPPLAAGLVLTIDLQPGKIAVTLRDGRARPVPSARAEGHAVLNVNGRILGVALLPAGGNRLVGAAPFQPGDEVGVEIAVSLDGLVARARLGLP